ncbi:IclR family transcriptional regulator [Microlunatus speluncae]|uniref:IclR family transcriptional regulator n=1 Tax=Microlunatus speluncae TaxID=2594267 RepID=UPI0012662855|nr:IclR family transcriptional regulator [Microlunatus speluncae]
MLRPASQDEDTAADHSPSSLSRGLALLDLFSEHDVELSISEMARRSGIPKSTTHRLVGDLQRWGALERGLRGMRLGVRLFELGHLVPTHAKLRELSIPYAHNLNEVTHLTCNFAVREGTEIIYIEKISTPALRVTHYRPGGRAPMHATGLGKAILAFSDPTFVDSVLAGPLEARTRKTITRPEVLRRELATIRESKVAFDNEESRPGLFCVAAPVFARRRTVVGAISVTGATALAQAQHFAPAVRTTAMAISRALDHPRPRR